MLGSKWHRLIWTGIMVIVLVAAGGCKTREQQADDEARERLPSLVGMTVSPIRAVFDQKTFSTTYTVEVDGAPEGLSLTAEWSGPDCGNWSRIKSEEDLLPMVSNRFEFKWYHPHPPCPETTDHTHVDVSAKLKLTKTEIIDGHLKFTDTRVIVCTYHGSESGTGKEPVWQN